MIAPMRAELSSIGFQECKTSDEVTSVLKNNETVLFVINSVCGCAAGNARPGVRTALEMADKKPIAVATSFAGNDVEAVAQIRNYMLPYPPSSPAMALFKNGKVVHMIERHNIEGKTANLVAANLVEAFDKFC